MTEFGAAASSSSPSSSSFTDRWPYHVFLSFRGEDTRQGFTGHLYNALDKRGIRTFIDDQGIRKGEEITPTLLKTIEESKTAIVVFSKDYASSTFCLTELVHIIDCMKGHNGRFIWPVFYHIDPSDIRHQKGSYKVAFDRYEGVKDETTVKRWRSALTEATSISGSHFDLSSKSYEYEIIEEIIEAVSKEISIAPMDVAHFPVGLESRVEEVCSLLNKHPHPDEATMVGIIGLGGIGKMTIARALYNKIASNFKHICFLHNVKEKFIHDLQKRLLSETVREKDMELEDYRCGIPIIMNRLHNKKVLLILDDIDTLEQLKALAGKPNWFGSGSIIIITTRDKNLLEKHEVERIYEAKELNDEEAHDLLIGNAVGKEAADPKYKEVINRAIEYARGLPLVLEILGSSMSTADSIWGLKTSLDMYEKIPNKTVQKILKVSFDGLEEMHKEIFLDIACFYREWRLRDVTIILSVCHNIDSEFCIRVMMDKSLIKINQYGWLDMHDLIQDMGKEIVRQESPRKAGKRSRLWSEEDILEVLNENTGTGKVQGVVDNVDKRMVEWSGDAFEKMKNLRVLRVSWDTKFSQGPKCLPNSLRVVEWDYYPSSTLPDNFCPRNLVILCLRYGRFKTLEIAFKKFFNLRKLNLEGCKSLEELPDMSGAADLEELNVSYCKKITKIDSSIGHLAKLKVLKAKSCKMLDTFIVGGIKLVSLEILKLSYCPKLCTFPEILVKIEKFKKLDLSETAIKKLPKSIENLIALEALHLRSCEELRQLPNLACFHKLKILDLRFCRMLKKVTGIRPNIEVFSAGWCTSLTSRSTGLLLSKKFFNLRKLNLEGCENLEELSDVSGVAYLEELDVGYCKKLTKIDDSVGYLAKLRVLNVERCEVLDTFIVGGIKLVSLEILNLRGCYKLHTFPEILVTMKKIKTLDLSDTAIKIFPDSIEKLVTLEALYLSSCKELRQLPNFALHNLKTLNLDWCKELEEIRGIPSSIEIFFAQSCISLTSHSTRLLLTQELHENGNTQFILPGKEIPKWFHKQSTEGSVSFWVRKKFPQIALCAILRNGPLISSSIEIHVNGTHKFDVRDVILPQIEIEIGIDHIILFDLRKEGKDFKIGRDLLEKELNHVVVSWHGMGNGFSYQFVECIGVYVYNYDSCMEDILFENPNPQRGTPEEVVHRICDLDLESLSVCYDDRGDFRDWIQEDDKLNKEIIDLSTETVSNIKKKGQLMVDDVNLTLSLALPEPSNDTTSHHDDKLNKEVMDSSAKAVSSIRKKKRKLKICSSSNN